MDRAPTPPRHAGIWHAGLVAAVVALLAGGVAVAVLVPRDSEGEPPVAAATATTEAPATTARTAPSTAPSTPTPSTPTPSTTAPTSTSTSPPTTSAVSTTTIAPTTPTAPPPLAVTGPIAPPSDPNGAEPLVQVGSISIPSIGLAAPMYEGIRLTTLNNGPGHWPGSAAPGQIGNAVVAGHRTSHNAEFRRLDRLVAGDIVTFTTPDGVFDYSVEATEIVGPDAMWIVDPSATPTATLFACHPPGSTRQRIVVKLALLGSALPPVVEPSA